VTAAEAPADLRTGAPLRVARVAAFLVVIGAAVTPPLVSLASIVWLASVLRLPDLRARFVWLRGQPLLRGWAVLVAVLLLSAVYGLGRGLPPAEVGVALLGWRHLLLLPLALLVFDEVVAQRRFVLGFVVFAVVAALAALLALAVGFSKSEAFSGVVLRNQVTQALVFAAGTLMAGALAWRTPAGGRRVALALAALFLLAVLVFLQTGRSGFVALVVGAGALLVLSTHGRTRLVALVVLPVAVAALVAASPTLQQRFAQGLSEARAAAQADTYTSMGIRRVIWDVTGELVAARPLAGYGLGGYAPAYAERIAQRYRDGWQATPTTDPHNQYLYLWAEAGVAGLLALALLLAGAWRQRSRAGEPALHAALGLALLAAWCVNSLFSSHFQTFNEGHLIVVFAGVLLARERLAGLQPSAARASVRTAS
jgi:O-antigen ligase